MKTLINKLIFFGHSPEDSEEEKLRKSSLVVMSAPFALAGFLWGLLYFSHNLFIPGFIPFVYGILSVLSIVHFGITKKYRIFKTSQLLLILLLPFFLQLSLGGFVQGSAVILWSIIAPLGALVFEKGRRAIYWFFAFILFVSIAYILDGKMNESINYELSNQFVKNLFLMNVLGFSSIVYIIQSFFMGNQSSLLKLLEDKNKWIKAAFQAYISPNIVEHLINHPEELKLSGERRECTFVFTDLVGFTSLVEQGDPGLIVSSLNEYFEGMTEIVFKHEGTVSKIMGDAIAVMFSAPVIQEDHAERAVKCALEMDLYAKEFAKKKQKEGLNFGMTRIGVNTGSVIVGNIGSQNQLDYRALGDAINTAARLESVNKYIGTNVCVSLSTIEKCPNFVGRPIGSLMLQGKSVPVPTFEPLSKKQVNSKRIQMYKIAFNLLEKSCKESLRVFEVLVKRYPLDSLANFHFKRLKSGKHGAIIIVPTK